MTHGSPLLYRLVYSSVATVKLDEAELVQVLASSRKNNQDAGITGVLLLVDSGRGRPAYYVQLLEGPRDAVDATYERITQDDLHTQLQVLSTGPVTERQFADWTMRREDLDEAGFLGLAGRGHGANAALGRRIRDPWSVEAAIRRLASSGTPVG